jgi:hypothetical protein
MKTTYTIADPDQAGQCRIVACDEHDFGMSALVHYGTQPDEWRAVGLMDAKGFLIAMTAPKGVIEAITDSQPLAAGTTFTFDITEAELENMKLRDLLHKLDADACASHDDAEIYTVSAALVEEIRKFLHPET